MKGVTKSVQRRGVGRCRSHIGDSRPTHPVRQRCRKFSLTIYSGDRWMASGQSLNTQTMCERSSLE